MLLHPPAGGELADDALVELPAGRIIDGLDAGVRELELGLLQGPGEPLVLAGEPLGVDEQAEALIEAVTARLGMLLLLGPGGGHGGELEGLQLLHCRRGEHTGALLYW